MSFPDIHSCTQFAAENVELKKRIQKIRQQRDEILKELTVLREEKKKAELLRNYATTRDVYVQTEQRPLFRSGQTLKPPDKHPDKHPAEKETDKTNKLLSMHSQLMKRYEKEVKQNIEHVETISNLNVRLTEQEGKLKEEKERVLRLEAELAGAKGHKSAERELREIAREKAKLKKENKKLRAELDGLDENFFDEIEDIKFAFQQSARLNKEYEKALRKMCTKFGVPYPHPENAVLKPLPS